MFWALRLKAEIEERFAYEIKSNTPLIIRDEKTMSGRVHVGSLRGVIIHGILSEILQGGSIANRYLFEINDFDPMDGLPVYIDQERFRPFMGRLLCDVPSPDGSAKNYAEYWAQDFDMAVKKTGVNLEYYRSSEKYLRGAYNEAIKKALDNADTIRKIYREVSGSEKGDDWLPIQVVCEECGKVGTTRAVAWDGKKVTYRCKKDLVTWAEGCEHKGSVDPFDGRAKLPWKVEWPAKFMVMGVHIEGGGKDHYTKGGSRDIARRILAEVFAYPEPLDVPYNFFVIGGKKMSSSKGKGSSAAEIAELLPTPLLRFLMMKEPKKEIDFEPSGDTIPILYDTYDGIAAKYWTNEPDDWASVFPHLHTPAARKNFNQRFLPRFSQIAYLVQMPHIDVYRKIAEMKGASLSAEDKAEVDERAQYANHWLDLYSPEKYKFQIQETLPPTARNLSSEQKEILRSIRSYLIARPDVDGETLHSHIHELKKQSGLPAADVFAAIYLSILGKSSGPQAGWFLTALGREFVLQRLVEASAR